MVVTTKFITVRIGELAAIGRNEEKGMFLVFKSGATHNIVYGDKAELTEDYLKINQALQANKKAGE